MKYVKKRKISMDTDIVFDFYGEGKTEFYNKFEGVESVLIQGKHWDKPPLVTILLTTYKRCDLLKEALDSAINQIGFDDYQILVVDNEGEDIEVVTDTAKLLSKYDSDKVIYYRHKESVSFKMDNAVKLAKSKWIVFLHDDDILSPYHLKILTGIATRNREAKYLSCPIISFESGNNLKHLTHGECYEFKVYTNNKDFVCLGYYPGWLGALIDREAYIETGGMPTYSNNLGDFCMVQKFHYKYGIWEVRGSAPLYFYRSWKGQSYGSGSSVMTKLYIEEYKYYKYVSRLCFPRMYKFWDRISSYRVLRKARKMNTGPYQCGIDLAGLAKQAHMSTNSLNKNVQYVFDMACFLICWAIVKWGLSRKRDAGNLLLWHIKKSYDSLFV